MSNEIPKRDALQELIQSMSRNEKGYFKKYCGQYSSQKDQKYLLLFDAMERQQEYNEQDLLKKLIGQIGADKLSHFKNYLYQLILKVLEQFYSSNFPEIEIRNMINQALILYKRGLVEHAKKQLRKAKKIANKFEDLYALGEILQLEQKLLNISSESKTSFEQNDVFFSTEINNIRQIEQLILSRRLERMIVDQHWMKGLGNQQQSVELFDQELSLIKSNDTLSVIAQLHYNNANLLYQYVHQRDIKKAFEFAEKNYRLVRDNPMVGQTDESRYMRIIYSYLGFCLPLKKEKAFLDGIEILQNFSSKDLQTQANAFDIRYNLLFNYSLSFGVLDLGKNYVHNFQNEVPKFINKLSGRSQIILYHLAAYICHLSEDYEVGLDFINRIYNLKDYNTRIDIQCVARIQEILIHFELENWLLLISKVRNYSRFLKKCGHLYPKVDLLLRSINSVANNPATGYQQVFNKLKIKLNSLTDNLEEERFLEHFDFLSWINSKLENQSFRTIHSKKE